MEDLLYYFGKTDFKRYELGKVQNGFNMSLVIDGTKDSCKMVVLSYTKKEIDPNTIIYHKATQTWWILANDKVSRYENESGYFYQHELSLEGAIELLNARDLTDSGFNSNRYNIGEFINRLFALSNFEYSVSIVDNGNLAQDKVVDYIKTFENYTLLSALREFLDGYNCVAKLTFNTTISGNDTLISSANILIVSKTGNVNVLPRNAEETFNDVRDIRNATKGSYGTSVISNAENVVSTKAKTYPSVGGVKLSSKTNKIDGTTAILRLPSNIFKVNYLDIYKNTQRIGVMYGALGTIHYEYYDESDISTIITAYNNMLTFLEDNFPSEYKTAFENQTTFLDLRRMSPRLYYCDNYDPVSKTFYSEHRIYEKSAHNLSLDHVPLVITNKELSQTLEYPEGGICFQRGNDYIENFICFNDPNTDNKVLTIIGFTDADGILYKTDYQTFPFIIFIGSLRDMGFGEWALQPNVSYPIKDTSFSVNYIPMSDLKIKMDNYGDTIDSVLYNQNGKLNDSNSLSKVLLSYSKEIESDTITKYGTYYGGYVEGTGFMNGGMPSVGDTILVDSVLYVINNISIDFNPNESTTWNVDSLGYYITCEVSLSKRVATKSLLTSPNTNIRDYGIPQNNNVKRKQLYRDFYEFSYEQGSENGNWYMPLSKVLNLSNEPQDYQNHIAVINTTFNTQVNGQFNYFYQLETTTYFLKKSVYEIVDFKDNNIIGYGFQNLWSGFDITKIFISGNDGNYNTPISYVDNNGEIEGLRLKLTTIDYLTDAYNNYDTYDPNHIYNSGDTITKQKKVYECNTNGTTGAWDSTKWDETEDYTDVSIYNANVFIPREIYDYLTIGKYDFAINESSYEKDALEVPVFEYSCQVDDTEDVIVGENVLDRLDNDVAYLYSYILVPSGVYNDNNYMLLKNNIPLVTINAQNEAYHVRAVQFDTTHIADNGVNQPPYFTLKLYASETIDVDNGTKVLGQEVPLSDLDDMTLLVVRHNINEDDIFTNVVGELAMETVQASLPTGSSTYRNKIIVLSDGTYAICEPDQYSLSITMDSHTYGYFTLIRQGVYLYNRYVIRDSISTTIDVLEDDIWSLDLETSSGYYLTEQSQYGGTIHNAGDTLSLTSKHYQTINVVIPNGVSAIRVQVDDMIRTFLTSGTWDNVRQDSQYSFSTTELTGWDIVSGGSQATSSVGENDNNTITIEPVMERETRTLSVNISGTGYGTLDLWYKQPDDVSWTKIEDISEDEDFTLDYGTEYYWTASASTSDETKSYIAGNSSGGSEENPLIVDTNRTIYAVFGKYRRITLSVNAYASATITVERGTQPNIVKIVDNVTIIPNATYNQNIFKDGDVYKIKFTPNANCYFDSGTQTEYNGTISADLTIAKVNGLEYRKVIIHWTDELASVNVGGTDFTNPNQGVVDQVVMKDIRQDYTDISFSCVASTGWDIDDYGSGTSDFENSDLVISPTFARETRRITANITGSGVIYGYIYIVYKEPDSTTYLTSTKRNGEYIDLDYGTVYTWSVHSDDIDHAYVVSGGSNIDTQLTSNKQLDAVVDLNPVITASIGGNGSGVIEIKYTYDDIEHTEELENNDTLTLRYGTSYSWSAKANSGSYEYGETTSGSGILNSDITLETNFALYKSFTWTSGSHAKISVKVFRNGSIEYQSGNVTTYTLTDCLKSTDTWTLVESADSDYYFESNGEETRNVSGDFTNATWTGENALQYRKLEVLWLKRITKVSVGENDEFDRPTNVYPIGQDADTQITYMSKIKQGLTYSVVIYASSGFTADPELKTWNTTSDGSLLINSVAVPNTYTINWTKPTGVATISVNRTSSPYKNADTGLLDQQDIVYYGDTLEITYTAQTGYKVSNTQPFNTYVANVTVEDNIVLSSYVTATPIPRTSKIIWHEGVEKVTFSDGQVIVNPYPRQEIEDNETNVTINSGVVTWVASAYEGYTFQYGTISSGSWDTFGSMTPISPETDLIEFQLVKSIPNTIQSVIVTRNGVELSNGATLYYWDNLVLTYTAKQGYAIISTNPVNVVVKGNINTYDYVETELAPRDYTIYWGNHVASITLDNGSTTTTINNPSASHGEGSSVHTIQGGSYTWTAQADYGYTTTSGGSINTTTDTTAQTNLYTSASVRTVSITFQTKVKSGIEITLTVNGSSTTQTITNGQCTFSNTHFGDSYSYSASVIAGSSVYIFSGATGSGTITSVDSVIITSIVAGEIPTSNVTFTLSSDHISSDSPNIELRFVNSGTINLDKNNRSTSVNMTSGNTLNRAYYSFTGINYNSDNITLTASCSGYTSASVTKNIQSGATATSATASERRELTYLIPTD